MSILHRPDMPVLTLHQPWATLIAEGQKWIETRPNRTHPRHPLYVKGSQPLVPWLPR